MNADELSDSEEYLLIPTDHRETLRATDWADDFGVGERLEAALDPNATDAERAIAESDGYDIGAICTAVNRYLLETEKTKGLLEQKKNATRLLHETSATMDKLKALLEVTEGNAYTSSAIFATLDAATLDEQITEIGEKTQELCHLLEALSPIYTRAADLGNYSDALPTTTKGRQPGGSLDKLIATLEKHIRRIWARMEGAQSGQTEIANAISETLRKTTAHDVESKTIANRLSQGGGYQDWLIAQAEKSKLTKNSD